MTGRDGGDWRRTQFAVVGGVFVYFADMNFVMPFLPLYIQELDGIDLAQAALWAGIIVAISPLVSGTVAPLWGMLADPYGPKLMLVRSMLGFSICLALLGLATTAWHLLARRFVTGFFGRFSSAAATIISMNNPREHLTSGLGRTHAARVLGLGRFSAACSPTCSATGSPASAPPAWG